MSYSYHLTLDCETCDEEMRVSILSLDGQAATEAVININVISQLTFECENCGGITYTSDIDEILMHKPGRDTDD